MYKQMYTYMFIYHKTSETGSGEGDGSITSYTTQEKPELPPQRTVNTGGAKSCLVAYIYIQVFLVVTINSISIGWLRGSKVKTLD